MAAEVRFSAGPMQVLPDRLGSSRNAIMVLVAEYVLKGGTFGENVVLIVECLHMGAGGMESNARDAGKTSTGVPATATALGVARHDFLQHLAPQAMDWISFLRIALPSHDRTRNRSALRSSKRTC